MKWENHMTFTDFANVYDVSLLSVSQTATFVKIHFFALDFLFLPAVKLVEKLKIICRV